MKGKNTKKMICMVIALVFVAIATVIMLIAFLKIIPILIIAYIFWVMHELCDPMERYTLDEASKIAEECGEHFDSEEQLMKAVKIRRTGFKKVKYKVRINNEEVELTPRIIQILTETDSKVEALLDSFFNPIINKLESWSRKLGGMM